MNNSIRILCHLALYFFVAVFFACCEKGNEENGDSPDFHLDKNGSETIDINGYVFKMIKVKGGTFMMGATSEQEKDAWEDETPVHEVTLSDFYIGETEVTERLWEIIMSAHPINEWSLFPKTNITWEECQIFINALNTTTGKHFRLPTEAEWEFAARGGNQSKGFKYSGSNDIDEVAWYRSNSFTVYYDPVYQTSEPHSHAVGTKSPNELGLYDMNGNVWEWCYDWYGSYSSSAQMNPNGPDSGSSRVVRGGSYNSWDFNCRVSSRGRIEPTNYYRNPYRSVGIRLALSAP